MKSRKILGIIGMVAAALIIFGGLAILSFGMRYPFHLDSEYYQAKDFTTIQYNELTELIAKKKSFVVFVYQPMCAASADFEEVLDEFRTQNQVSIYKIAFSDIKDTEIGQKIQHYPSFAIFKQGTLVEYLDAEADEDTEYYQAADKFKEWFIKYISLKKSTNSDAASGDDTISEERALAENISLDNVTKEADKVNVYFFWGDGCPHCAAEFEALEEIRQQYGDKFKLYAFETWYNDENAELAKIFSKALDGKEVKGVPYTIIGKKSFTGFGDDKDAFIKAITEQYQDPYDIYFDKIRK